MSQREKFETTIKALAQKPEESFDCPYEDDDANTYWVIWQASRRAALEECWEAVRGERLEAPTETHGDMAYEHAVEDCENAIRALATETNNADQA